MDTKNKPYERYGDEWAAELMKHKKTDIVKMYQKSMRAQAIIPTGSLTECQRHVEGIVNDYDAGIFDKEQMMEEMGKYTERLMGIFWEGAKRELLTHGRP